MEDKSKIDEARYEADGPEEEEDDTTMERSSFCEGSQETLEDEEELPRKLTSMHQEEPTSTQLELTSKQSKDPTSTQGDELSEKAKSTMEGSNRGITAAGEETPVHSQDYVEMHAPQDMGGLDYWDAVSPKKEEKDSLTDLI